MISRKEEEQYGSPLWVTPVVILAVLLLLVIIVGGGLLLWMPQGGRPQLGEGEFGIAMEGEEMTLSWAQPSNADAVRIFLWNEELQEYDLYGEFAENSTVIPGVKDGDAFRLKLQAVRYAKNLLGQDRESVSKSAEATIELVELDCPVLQKSTEPESKSVTLSWIGEDGNRYEFYRMGENGGWEQFAETGSQTLTLHFGADETFALPDRQMPIRLCARAVRSGEGCTYYGVMSEAVLVEREELLGTDPALSCEAAGENRYILRWEEAKGNVCELQQWSEDGQQWETVESGDWSQAPAYETDRLPSGTEMRFRVIGYNSEEQKEAEAFAAGPSEIAFWTEISPLYCTVWPVVPVELFSDAQEGETLDTVAAGEALCVLGEQDDHFAVRYRGQDGFVQAGYCMINLPEYLGDLCEYNITNSYDSIFRVHEYDIPEITGTVIEGYESVCLENDDLLVPFLYPCAKRLELAAKNVWEDGYCLRIYDAFRPNEATRYLYDTVEALLDTPVPKEEENENGEEPEEGEFFAAEGQEELSRYEKATRAKREREQQRQTPEDRPDTGTAPGKEAGVTDGPEEGLEAGTVEGLPEGTQEAWIAAFEAGLAQGRTLGLIPQEGQEGTQEEPESGQEEPQEQKEGVKLLDFLMSLTPEQLESFAMGNYIPGMENIVLGEEGPTYLDIMTDGRFKLSAFLAAVTSAHNRGIALDLTLVDRGTGGELPMQSSMHDLSWNSILSLNNDNAKLLSEYMLAVGFRGLTSEWWHFQDDETREALQLNSYLAKGVSVAGWKKDDTGWRYRLENGGYLKNTTETVEGEICSFDADGYVR